MTVTPRAAVDSGDFSAVLRDMMSGVGAITAAAASNQAGGTPITRTFNRITTVGTAGDSVTLPVARPGALIFIKNSTATSADVFPAVGDAINALGANNAFALGATTGRIFFCAVAGVWDTV
jgi:hypothetical protein